MSLSRLLPAAPLLRKLPASGYLLVSLPISRPLLHLRALSLATPRHCAPKDSPGKDFFIPEPPNSPVTDPTEVLNHLGEPTFKSLGLGTGYFPSDFFLNIFEFLHVSAGLPWWMTIGVVTLSLRLLLFPLVVYHRKKSILYQNNFPTLQKLKERLDKAQLQNNIMEIMHTNRELASFVERNEMLSPKNLILLPGVNIVVLLSCLHALRGMAKYPVVSLQDGGLFWFSDLCVSDPYFVLPLFCCGSLYLMLYIGADVVKLSNTSPVMRYVMAGFPILGFFLIMNMPAAVTYYFMVANCVSFAQTAFLKLPSVKKFLDMPLEVKHPKPEKKPEGKGFIQNFKQGVNRNKLLKIVQERERIDDERFRAAGKAPVQQTRAVQRKKKVERTKELRKA